MLWRTAGLAGAIITCVAATPAAASTVTTRIDSDNPNFGRIVYSAAPGEVNRLTVTEVDDQTLRVVDTGAVIVPSGGCQTVNAHTAICTTATTPGEPFLIRANVWAGDMNDVVRTDGPGLAGNGGPGDDTLEGDSIVAGRLDGGGGRDSLIGGSNADVFVDGDTGGAADADRMEGRGDPDTVSYAGRSAPVRVSLPNSSAAGETGEGDVLVSIERAIGGSGDDDLRGGSGRNTLEGRAGDDRLFARGGEDFVDGGSGDDDIRGGRGPDTLTAGLGTDTLRGGRGNDILFVRRTGSDAVSCGRQRGDTVVDPSRRDLVKRDCEDAVFNYGTRQMSLDAFPHRRDSTSATFDLRCPSDEVLDGETIAIAGRMRLRRATGDRALLGRATIPRKPGRRCGDEDNPLRVRVRIELNERGRRLASRPDGVLAEVGITGFHLPDARWRIRLKV
jgi:hypothetical protein